MNHRGAPPHKLATFSSFPQRLHVSRGLPPGQDVALRVPGEDVSRQAEDETLDELGLLVFLLRDKERKNEKICVELKNGALVVSGP